MKVKLSGITYYGCQHVYTTRESLIPDAVDANKADAVRNLARGAKGVDHITLTLNGLTADAVYHVYEGEPTWTAYTLMPDGTRGAIRHLTGRRLWKVVMELIRGADHE